MNTALDDPRLKKLNFRAWRRGIREADLILGPFSDSRLPAMSAAELDVFEALLETPDQEFYAWIIEREAPPVEADGPLLREIIAFRHTLYGAHGPAGG